MFTRVENIHGPENFDEGVLTIRIPILKENVVIVNSTENETCVIKKVTYRISIRSVIANLERIGTCIGSRTPLDTTIPQFLSDAEHVFGMLNHDGRVVKGLNTTRNASKILITIIGSFVGIPTFDL